MKINQEDARTFLYCMNVTDREIGGLNSVNITQAVELAKFAGCKEEIAHWQKRWEEEKQNEYYAGVI